MQWGLGAVPSVESAVLMVRIMTISLADGISPYHRRVVATIFK